MHLLCARIDKVVLLVLLVIYAILDKGASIESIVPPRHTEKLIQEPTKQRSQEFEKLAYLKAPEKDYLEDETSKQEVKRIVEIKGKDVIETELLKQEEKRSEEDKESWSSEKKLLEQTDKSYQGERNVSADKESLELKENEYLEKKGEDKFNKYDQEGNRETELEKTKQLIIRDEISRQTQSSLYLEDNRSDQLKSSHRTRLKKTKQGILSDGILMQEHPELDLDDIERNAEEIPTLDFVSSGYYSTGMEKALAKKKVFYSFEYRKGQRVASDELLISDKREYIFPVQDISLSIFYPRRASSTEKQYLITEFLIKVNQDGPVNDGILAQGGLHLPVLGIKLVSEEVTCFSYEFVVYGIQHELISPDYQHNTGQNIQLIT